MAFLWRCAFCSLAQPQRAACAAKVLYFRVLFGARSPRQSRSHGVRLSATHTHAHKGQPGRASTTAFFSPPPKHESLWCKHRRGCVRRRRLPRLLHQSHSIVRGSPLCACLHQIAPLSRPCCCAASDWASPAWLRRGVVCANRLQTTRWRGRNSHGERDEPDFEQGNHARKEIDCGWYLHNGLLLSCCLTKNPPQKSLNADLSPHWPGRQRCSRRLLHNARLNKREGRQGRHCLLTVVAWECIRIPLLVYAWS